MVPENFAPKSPLALLGEQIGLCNEEIRARDGTEGRALNRKASLPKAVSLIFDLIIKSQIY
jgi:hypothetical protein